LKTTLAKESVDQFNHNTTHFVCKTKQPFTKKQEKQISFHNHSKKKLHQIKK
jgi:hypothetical protein